LRPSCRRFTSTRYRLPRARNEPTISPIVASQSHTFGSPKLTQLVCQRALQSCVQPQLKRWRTISTGEAAPPQSEADSLVPTEISRLPPISCCQKCLELFNRNLRDVLMTIELSVPLTFVLIAPCWLKVDRERASPLAF